MKRRRLLALAAAGATLSGCMDATNGDEDTSPTPAATVTGSATNRETTTGTGKTPTSMEEPSSTWSRPEVFLSNNTPDRLTVSVTVTHYPSEDVLFEDTTTLRAQGSDGASKRYYEEPFDASRAGRHEMRVEVHGGRSAIYRCGGQDQHPCPAGSGDSGGLVVSIEEDEIIFTVGTA